jgi:SSS family solute:Na+ symporter
MENLFSGLFLALTTVAYMVVAALASKGVSTQDDYLLGARQFSVRSITLTLIATQLGAGMIFGTAAQAYDRGIIGIAYVLGMAVGLIILGLGVGARLRSLNISTTAELFETKYQSKFLRKLAAFISILTMGGILAAQIVASKQLFSTLFEINQIWLVLFWICIIGYTTFGGLKAIVATDMLQVIMIVIVFTFVLFYIVPVADIPTVLSSNTLFSGPIFSDGFFAALIAPALFSVIEQDLAQRCFAAKTKRVASISALLAAGFLLLYAFVPIILGMYAKMSGITYASGQSPLVLLFQAKLSTFGMTIVACALLAAICSTADSLLGAASSNLVADFLPANGKFSLALSRVLTLLLGILALFIAFNFNDVIGIIIKSYEISICALFIPLVLAMYIKTPSKLGGKLSVILGITTFLFMTLVSASTSPTVIGLFVS